MGEYTLLPEITETARYRTFALSAVASAVTFQVPTLVTFVVNRVVVHFPSVST